MRIILALLVDESLQTSSRNVKVELLENGHLDVMLFDPNTPTVTSTVKQLERVEIPKTKLFDTLQEWCAHLVPARESNAIIAGQDQGDRRTGGNQAGRRGRGDKNDDDSDEE